MIMTEIDGSIVFANSLVTQELNHVDKARITDEPQLEHSEIKQSENTPGLSKTDLLKVLLFAWAGNVIVYTSNLYLLSFLARNLTCPSRKANLILNPCAVLEHEY